MPNITAGFSWPGLLLLLALALAPGLRHDRLHAQETRVWTKEEIVERLMRTEPEPLTRSLRGIVVGGGPDAAVAEPDAAGWIDDLRVTFPFDSAEITPEARQTLDVLGEALLDGRLSQDRFEIAGHTDGVGDEVRSSAELLLSFGSATWPHLLVRAMLAEQLFRATSILANHPYHREG